MNGPMYDVGRNHIGNIGAGGSVSDAFGRPTSYTAVFDRHVYANGLYSSDGKMLGSIDGDVFVRGSASLMDGPNLPFAK